MFRYPIAMFMIGGAIAALFFVGLADSQAQTKILSHPPLRKNPAPADRAMGGGPAYHVDAEKGDDANDGGVDSAWRTIGHALKQLKAGDTLYLRGGSYFENVYVSLVGRSDAPITLRSYPGEQAVIDGGIREFQYEAADAWEPFPQGAADEYRSKRAYPNIRDVVGAFGDSDVGLQTYWHTSDLRSQNELVAPADNGDIKPLYCGPGLFYDRATGHIHVRLAHTKLKAFENYRGETDPRKLPMVIAPFRSVPLHVDHAQHVRFQDLVIRGGGYETTVVTYGVNIDFDNCTIRGGTYCMRTENTGPFRFYRSAMYGNAPPWSFRGDGSLRARPGRPTRDIARLTCHAVWVTDTGREFSVYAFPMNDDWEVAYSEFTDSHDGPYLGGISMKFHHNLIDNFQDDGIYLSQMYPRHLFMGEGGRIEIYQNYFSRALTPIAFGGMEDTRDDIYIYRNVVDLRGGVNYGRPSEQNPNVGPYATNRVMSDHGGPPWPKMTIYHNTFVTLGGAMDQGTMGHLKAGNPRAVFNNIYFNFGSLGGLQPPSHELGQADGNLYWSPGSEKAAETFFNRYRNSPLFGQSKAVYSPGFTTNSLAADPRFVKAVPSWPDKNEYTLEKGSPAIDAGVALPADWPDSSRASDKGKPDIGAIPFGEQFRYGRDAAP